ncbi:MAG TPA: glucose-6-phosphate dehydrogenase [Rectinemataceae bacterium]|nr:glucose-6-phosphate dehydrogenase [Rectinemataceae bacterium]
MQNQGSLQVEEGIDLDACVGCDLEEEPAPSSPAVIVIFGATGDLAARKILPALYNLSVAGRFHPDSRIIAIGRKDMASADFRESMASALRQFSRSGRDEGAWSLFARRIEYLRGDLADSGLYSQLRSWLGATDMPRTRIYYLAVGPDQFGLAAEGLAAAGLGTAASGEGAAAEKEGGGEALISRLVVEKPFGSDLASARELSSNLQRAFRERDIFRIDHYLGKETVQNLLYLRFANSFFEPLWNRDHIEKVEIEVLETVGIGSRGGYYDKAGAARDMLQNHLLQLLCLTAMEPPASLDPEAIRNEKVKVLKSIPRYEAGQWKTRSIRARYAEGLDASGSRMPSYLQEDRVDPASTTETYVAVRLELDNWRFAGVPFVLRTGKALDRRSSEIRIHFRAPPRALFNAHGGELGDNVLTIRIQPDEGVWFTFNMKVPGRPRVESRDLRFTWPESGSLPEAYERLLDDAIRGDSTLFIRSDESEAAWEFVDALRESWTMNGKHPLLDYPAGSKPPGLSGGLS